MNYQISATKFNQSETKIGGSNIVNGTVWKVIPRKIKMETLE